MADGNIPVQVKILVQEIVKIEFEIQNIVQEIRSCQGPLTSLDNLNLQVKRKLVLVRERIESLGQIADEQDKESDVAKVKVLKDYHKKELASIQASIRTANLEAKHVIDMKDRVELVGSNEVRKRNYNKENLAKTASSITQDLMNCARMMENQVRQSNEDVQTLAASSTMVKDTHEEYKGLSGVIQMSKKLLNKYNRREVTDRLLIFFGLVLFFCTVLYILKKRLW